MLWYSNGTDNKLQLNYIRGRPFGGTAVLCNRNLACISSPVVTNNPRCCATKLSFKHCNDLIVVSVYMPCLTGCLEHKSIAGCLQGIIDGKHGCNFVFGGDFNLNKCQITSNVYHSLTKFSYKNNIEWLDPVVDKVQYTFHADNIGHFSLIDHMLVSECLVHDHQSVVIHVDDSNWSDHYAISCLVHTDNTQIVQSSVPSKKAVKLMWDKADLDLYRSVLQWQLSRITIPTDALLCDHCMCSEQHELLLDKHYSDIVNCFATSSEQSVLSQRVGFQKFWWTEELDDLKAATMEATSVWRCAGCLRSGPVNENRLQCKYRYNLAIKEAAADADRCFNDDLYDKLCVKDDQAFWKSWRKKFCSHSLKW